MNGKRRFLSTLFAAALLAACGGGDGFSGTWQTAGGMGTLTFADGTVTISSSVNPAMKQHFSYSVDGNKVTMHTPDGDETATIAPDGSLVAPDGSKLTRVD